MNTRRAAHQLTALTALIGLVALATPVGGQERQPGPEELASALTRRALVYIETFWTGYVSDEEGEYFNDGDPLEFASSCSGFVVNPAGYIATAGHCVDDTASFGGAKQRLIELAAEEAHEEGGYEGSPSEEELVAFGLANWTVVGTEEDGAIKREVFAQRGRATPRERAGSAMPARVVDFRSADSGDVALLKVDRTDLPSVFVADGPEPPPGTQVILAGYPAPTEDSLDDPIEPRTTLGQLTAAKTQGNYRVYELTAAIADGMSGGPTVNLEGEVIGINSFRTGGGDTSSFIVSVEHLREVLVRNQVASEPESAWAKPSEPPPAVAEERSPVLPLGIGLFVLAAIGGTVLLRPGRRRHPDGDPPTFS